MSNVIPLRKNPNRPQIEPKFFLIEDVAAITKMSPTTVRRRIASGDIRVKRFGRLVRIPKSELDRLEATDNVA